MKKIITGASVTVAGALIFLSVFVAAGSLVSTMGAWLTEQGRFWSCVSDAKLYPVLALGILMMAAGVALMVWGNVAKTDRPGQDR